MRLDDTKLVCRTTHQHYEKYQAMLENLHINLIGSKCFPSKDRLVELFILDPALNNILLKKFDGFYPSLRMYQRDKVKEFGPHSLAENTCLYKHALIYQVIGAEPEFTDNECPLGNDHLQKVVVCRRCDQNIKGFCNILLERHEASKTV